MFLSPGGEVRAEVFTLPTGQSSATTDIQAAADAVVAKNRVPPVWGGTLSQTLSPTLRLEDGAAYLLDGAGLVLTSDLHIIGNRTLLFNNTASAPVVTANGYRLTMEGVYFAGGNGHVSLVGANPAVVGMRSLFRNCCFGPTAEGARAIVADPADSEQTGLAMMLTLRDCTFDKCLPLGGQFDDVLIDGGMAYWTVADGDWLDVTGNVRIYGVQGVPINAGSDNAWIKIAGTLDCAGFRFGGETGGARILHYHDSGDATYPGAVGFRGCQMFCAGRPWGLFEGDFPHLTISPCQGYAQQGAVVDAVAEASLDDVKSQGLIVDIGGAGSAINPYFVRANGTVIERLQQIQQRGAICVTTPTTQDASLLTDALDVGAISSPTLTNLETDGTVSYNGGTLTKYKATAVNGNGVFSLAGWGTGKPAGTYQMEFAAVASENVRGSVTLDGSIVGTFYVGATATGFRRIVVPFFFDGVGGDLSLTLIGGAADSIFAVGYLAARLA